MNSYENKILEAIEIIANQKIDEADFNKTVQATIIKMVDAASAHYLVKYQDSRFDAFAVNKTKQYQDGQNVYVLFPGNDTKQDKMIIGPVEKNAEFVTTIVDAERYEIVGTNCANSLNDTFELCSYTHNGDIKVLYDRENKINLIHLNTRDVQEYIQQSSILCCGADFRTQLSAEQQLKGNYGIVFELAFEDGLMKNYMVDINQMVGNPYKLTKSTTQKSYFEIGEGFQYVNKIYIFEKDFPYTDDNRENDIFVKNIFIGGAIGLTSDELLSTRVMLETPDGNYFLQTEDINEKRIKAKIKVSGKTQEDISSIKFYWFKENSNIDLTNPKYNHAGGAGWEYLTDGTNIYTVHKTDIISEEQMYKCVADIGGVLYSQVVIFKNYDTEIKISIQSSNGTVFYYDMGEITLTCNVEGGDPENEYSYHWTFEDSGSGTTFLENNTNIQNVYIKDISLSRKYICSIYLGDVCVGTSSIILYNQTNTQDIQFQLKVLNSDILYQYDIDGNKPEIEIKPLKCILQDADGNEIDENIFSKCKIIWTCPQEKSMMKDFDADLNNLTYTIEDRYDIGKTNNKIGVQIQLDTQYIYEEFSINFIKKGEVGTNGTRYTGKIIINAKNDLQYPVYSGSSQVTFWNCDLYSSSKWFKIQLWKDSKKIYEGYSDGTSTENKQVQLKWNILKNKYTNEISDYSKINIDENNNYTARGYIPEGRVAASIIQCEISYNGIKIYCTKSLLEGESWPGNKVLLVEGTGFTNIQYNSQGRNPKYQNDIFELQVLNQNGLDITKRDLTFNWSTYGQIWDGSAWKEVSIVNIIEDSTLSAWKKRIQPNSEWNGECVTAGVKVDIYQSTNYIATLKIPIHGYLDRSMNQAIEGWNGNSVQLKQSGGYLYTPQIGAGKKESDKSFTGMIMGKAREENVEKTGLLGYSHGEQSLFLDAESGGAVFGKGSQGGQLAFDPNAAKSLLYSKNYWKQYNNKGFPKNYDNANKNGQGMIIDLTTPEIIFGNGKSKITKDGFLEYEGGLTSEGIFVTLDNRIMFDDPYKTWGDKMSGTAFGSGQIGYLPYQESKVTLQTYTQYGETYTVEAPSKIGFKNITIETRFYLPENFQVSKAYLDCQYRSMEETEYVDTQIDPGYGIIDPYFFYPDLGYYNLPPYVQTKQIVFPDYTQTTHYIQTYMPTVAVYVSENFNKEDIFIDKYHFTPIIVGQGGISPLPNYENGGTLFDNNMTKIATINTTNAENNVTHFQRIDITNQISSLETGKNYYIYLGPNSSKSSVTINDYYVAQSGTPNKYMSRNHNIAEIVFDAWKESLLIYADFKIEGYLKTDAFE